MTLLLDGKAIVRAIYKPDTLSFHVQDLLREAKHELLASQATI